MHANWKKTQRNEWLCSAKMCVKGRNRIIRERARTQHREKERVRFVRITMNSVMFAFCCTQLFHIPLKKYRRGFMHRTTHAHNLPFSAEHANFQRTYFAVVFSMLFCSVFEPRKYNDACTVCNLRFICFAHRPRRHKNQPIKIVIIFHKRAHESLHFILLTRKLTDGKLS